MKCPRLEAMAVGSTCQVLLSGALKFDSANSNRLMSSPEEEKFYLSRFRFGLYGNLFRWCFFWSKKAHIAATRRRVRSEKREGKSNGEKKSLHANMIEERECRAVTL